MTAITMLELRFGYFPQRFEWCGSIYYIHAMSSATTGDGRFCFRVRCKRESGDDPKRAVLDLALTGDKWAIEKVISKED